MTNRKETDREAWDRFYKKFADLSDIPKCLRRPQLPSGFCREEVDLRTVEANNDLKYWLWFAFFFLIGAGIWEFGIAPHLGL